VERGQPLAPDVVQDRSCFAKRPLVAGKPMTHGEGAVKCDEFINLLEYVNKFFKKTCQKGKKVLPEDLQTFNNSHLGCREPGIVAEWRGQASGVEEDRTGR
jgi:hypothetical protein